jgi:two-component system sensor histidine kinase KdpD
MAEARPDPDELLHHVKAEEARARRGRLRIFFGATAGVGKTYAMLEAARGARAAGTDLVLGYIETSWAHRHRAAHAKASRRCRHCR